jgi:hypothetical protein
MKLSDVIAMVAAAVAFIALFIGIYAAYVTERVAGSGFQSAERVKADTASLLAALRGIMVKAALYTQQDPASRDDEKKPDYIDVRPEKAVIQGFLNSPTAVAYYVFVAERSKNATKAGKPGEEWRVFFLLIADLLRTSNTYSCGLQAAKIEKMFDTVSDDDIESMSSHLEDLVGSVKGMIRERQNDVLMSVFVDKLDSGPDMNEFEAFVGFLRSKGIKDPDVDLFWASTSGDTEVAKDALKRGARVNVTDKEIISRYQQLWKEYSAQPSIQQDTSKRSK